LKREGKRTIGSLRSTFEVKVKVVKNFLKNKKEGFGKYGKFIRIFIKRHSG